MSATDKALDHLNDLRTEVRHLGAMLGRTIAELEGEQALATVELLRTLAKDSRTGNATAARGLAQSTNTNSFAASRT